MKKRIFIISAFILSSVTLFAQTQMEMNQSSYTEFKETETSRDKTISQIKSLYSDNAKFLIAFSEAENRWEKYRDAYLEMMFPGENKRELYGSVYPMVYSLQKTRVTQQHIEELQIWLIGIEEGDMGWGSVMLERTIKEKANKKLDPTVKTPVESGKTPTRISDTSVIKSYADRIQKGMSKEDLEKITRIGGSAKENNPRHEQVFHYDYDNSYIRIVYSVNFENNTFSVLEREHIIDDLTIEKRKEKRFQAFAGWVRQRENIMKKKRETEKMSPNK
jgi:hypothetical protein